jgi:hypothetical protein
MKKQPTDDVTQFHSVDQATSPAFFTQCMDKSHTLGVAQIYKQERMKQLGINPAVLRNNVFPGQTHSVIHLYGYPLGVPGKIIRFIQKQLSQQDTSFIYSDEPNRTNLRFP